MTNDNLHREWAAKALMLNKTYLNVRTEYKSNKIANDHFDLLVESIFLRAYGLFEAHLEQVFLAVVSEAFDPSGTDIQPLIRTKGPEVGRQIFLLGNPYLAWLPYRNTLNRAKAALVGGLPFERVSPPRRKYFDHVSSLRNHVAHKSPESLAAFSKALRYWQLPEPYSVAEVLRTPHQGAETFLTHVLREMTLISKEVAPSTASATP